MNFLGCFIRIHQLVTVIARESVPTLYFHLCVTEWVNERFMLLIYWVWPINIIFLPKSADTIFGNTQSKRLPFLSTCKPLNIPNRAKQFDRLNMACKHFIQDKMFCFGIHLAICIWFMFLTWWRILGRWVWSYIGYLQQPQHFPQSAKHPQCRVYWLPFIYRHYTSQVSPDTRQCSLTLTYMSLIVHCLWHSWSVNAELIDSLLLLLNWNESFIALLFLIFLNWLHCICPHHGMVCTWQVSDVWYHEKKRHFLL